MVDRKRALVFMDKDGKWFPLDEVNGDELAWGLEKTPKKSPRGCY